MKFFFPFLLLLLGYGHVHAEDLPAAPNAASVAMRDILNAIVEKDLVKFQSQMTPEVAKQVTKPLLDQVNANYGKMLGNKKNKYIYLGVIARADYKVFLWKIADGNSDEYLIKLTMINGKSGGIFIE